jgi:hypothetical protein
MATEKQVAANRDNATHSTGPRTAEGKSRSAQNALKHGFRAAEFTVINLEDSAEVEALQADLVHVYQPVNTQELFAIERMALAQQQILRASRLEAGLFSQMISSQIDDYGDPFHFVVTTRGEVTREQNLNVTFGQTFCSVNATSKAVPVMLRYQAQAERLYRRALEEFERLKKLRPDIPNDLPQDDLAEPALDEIPNEPISGPQDPGQTIVQTLVKMRTPPPRTNPNRDLPVRPGRLSPVRFAPPATPTPIVSDRTPHGVQS